ncbi:putative HTH cro/C1-type domain-containing protein [Azospirillaceae bacterium]
MPNMETTPSSFSSRLRTILDEQKSVLSFARKCEVDDNLLRRYLAGSEPGLDKVVRIAKAAGVSVQWLTTGEGPMRPEDESSAPPTSVTPPLEPAPVPDIDKELMGRLMDAIHRLYKQEGATISMIDLGRLTADKYSEIIQAAQTPQKRIDMIDLIVVQLRKDLISDKTNPERRKRLAS